MSAQSHWSHAEWKHDDEKRAQLTLGLSVLLHAVVLLAWKLPAPIWKAADQAVLTVVLRAASPPAQRSPAIAEKKMDVAVLVQKEPAVAAFSMPPKPAALGAVAPTVPGLQPAPAASRARLAAQPTPGRLVNSPPAPVGVTVLLVVGADGRAQQIYWNQLPALTDAQLRRVEAVIRERTYAAGQTVNELVDVRGILKLPPPQVDESSTALQPGGE